VGFCTFVTAIGRCAVAWTARGIVTVWLPAMSDDALLRQVQRRHPEAEHTEPPPPVRSAVDGMTRLLGGDDVDLSDVELDLSGVPEFHRAVYAAARALPRGATATYGEVARRVGQPGAAQAVGQALGANPVPIVVPCHRIVAAGGRHGGFSAPGGVDTKLRMLAIEGATLF
jgi:methylated-DNA-[protein]-cysteine S-methyltransferase